jgi:hypothetical protein
VKFEIISQKTYSIVGFLPVFVLKGKILVIIYHSNYEQSVVLITYSNLYEQIPKLLVNSSH